MPELSSLSELQDLRTRIRDEMDAKPRITICAETACQASGANPIIRTIKRYFMENNLLEQISLRITGCHGFCEMGPSIITTPQMAFYVKLTKDDIPRIIDATLKNEYVEELLYKDPITNQIYYNQNDIPFFKKQHRTLLEKKQYLDPIRLFNYFNEGGYLALEKVLANPDPKKVVDEVIRSGLRGRGGAGFLTGKKWQLAEGKDSSGGKYIVCNADEGDPGAYMDRSILEGNPHSVIEGMIIGGIGMRATEGVIFVRHEYPLAIKNTIIALRMAREYGLLGENILGTGINFDINIVQSAGAFVCGEETALIKTIEGYMGEPKQRPPYPIEKGVFGKPTCINNVETWANVPVIFSQGAEEYAKIGTPNNSGTKVFSVVGKIRNTGLVEVPMGTSIKKIVYDIGGGPADDGSKIKAIQIGGPSGGCIPASRFDLTIDYDSLTEAGAIMGSGGMIVMDESTCMVDVAKYFMGFLQDESCGKCFTCRKGTQRMYEILEDISNGVGTLDQLDLLEQLAQTVKDTTMCGLGQSAPNPVLSTLRYFRHEYERHIIDKRCDASVCKNLVGAPCQSACPIGTEAWRYVAHIGRGEYEEAYKTIRESNPFPSVCSRVCDHKCEIHCKLGTTGQKSVAIRSLKRFVTDTVDPSVYQPKHQPTVKDKKVAIVGAGPAGLSTAHYLSLQGYQSTVFDSGSEPGGMLNLGIPSYRLPRDILQKEIQALIDDNVTLKMNTTLGQDIGIDGLFKDGYDAVFLALGSLKSRRLGIDNEDVEGVYPSMQFLRSFNVDGKALARGKVGIIGGGNSALDAARIALRQEGVSEVHVLYRRTRQEMPAFAEEIEAGLEEGIKLQTLLTPTRIVTRDNALSGVEFLRNELGDLDQSGRRSPVPVEGSEHVIELDTLIVAISEQPDLNNVFQNSDGSLTSKWGTVESDPSSLSTARQGLFSGGDVVTGPNTVIDAIAAGKRAAVSIVRYLNGEPLRQSTEPSLPSSYVQPPTNPPEGETERTKVPHIDVATRTSNFDEVEQCLAREDAQRESHRCLRCDLDFTEHLKPQELKTASGGQA